MALFPQNQVEDADTHQVYECTGFYMVYLPHAEEIRRFDTIWSELSLLAVIAVGSSCQPGAAGKRSKGILASCIAGMRAQ